jgi:type II secretory pathway pseudopilin PulG
VRDDGQGLVELIVALTVLAIGIGALLTVLTSSALSLQRSGQKGTALTLAEKQIELYRNLTYPDVRLDHNMPKVDGIYTNAYLSDSNIPTATGERTDADPGTNPCDTSPECLPVQYVGPDWGVPTPDHRNYRIDTYIHEVPTNGGDDVAQVYVVVRNAQVSTYPILARSASTISAINIANTTGKSLVTMSFTAQRAALQNTSPDPGAITATLSGGVNETGSLDFYVLVPPATPSPPCPGTGWQQVDSVAVSGDGDYHPSAAAASAFTFASTGTYYWYATYSGDPVNKKASAPCGATMQSTTVQTSKWSPTLSLSSAATAIVDQNVPGSSITATVAGSSGYTPNTITLLVYGPTNTPPASGSCPTSPSGLWQSAGAIGPNGNGSFSPSTTFKPTQTGRYWWYASYPGDGTNNAASSRCDGSTSIAHIDVTVPPDTFSVDSLSGNSQTAGTSFDVRITAIVPDGSGPDVAYSGAKTITYSGPSTSPNGTAPSYQSSVTFTNGVATVPVTLTTAETATITATQGLVTGTSDPITVQAKPTAGFTVTNVGTQVAGAAFGATLTAVDAYGNPSQLTDGNYSITWSGPGDAPNGQAPQYGSAATTVQFDSGIGSAGDITLYKASTSTTLTATATVNSTTIQGTSTPFTVKGGSPAAMTFVNCSKPTTTNTTCSPQPVSVGNGSNKTMTANVGLLDAWSNVTSATSALTVNLTSSNPSKVTVTSPVNIPQGSTQSTQLTITTSNASATTITASAGGTPPNATLTVQS